VPRRMPWGFKQAHRAVVEEVAVAVQSEHFEFSQVTEVILAIDWPGLWVGPERISDLVALEYVDCLREI
jgi:hypothetical protein